MRTLLVLALLLAGCSSSPTREVGGVAPVASRSRLKPEPTGAKINGPKVRQIALAEINRRLDELTITTGGVYSPAASTLATTIAVVSTGVNVDGPLNASSLLVNGVAVGGGGFTLGLGATACVSPISSSGVTVNVSANSGVPYVDFSDGATEEAAQWFFVVPEAYDSASNATFKVTWYGSSAGTNSALLGASVGTLTGEDVNTTGYATILDTEVTSLTAAPATSGNLTTTTFTLSNAQADAIAAGDWVIFQLVRRSGDVTDTYTGSVEVIGVEVSQ